jgi:hypothetical protein
VIRVRQPKSICFRLIFIDSAVGGKKKRGVFRRPAFLCRSNYTQVITPGVVTPESQAFADRACEAVAVHEGGGPTTAVAVTVTSFEGVKP